MAGFCSVCGSRMPVCLETGKTSDTCSGCGTVHYLNPTPVMVLLVPVARFDGERTGILLVERAIVPKGLALPGGFLEMKEDWRAGAARELLEETGLVVAPSDIEPASLPGGQSLFSTPGGRQLLVFVTTPVQSMETVAPLLQRAGGDGETASISIRGIEAANELVFPSHAAAMRLFLERMG